MRIIYDDKKIGFGKRMKKFPNQKWFQERKRKTWRKLEEILTKPVHLEKSIKTGRLLMTSGDLTDMHSRTVFKRGKSWNILVAKPKAHKNRKKNLNATYLMFSIFFYSKFLYLSFLSFALKDIKSTYFQIQCNPIGDLSS